MSEQDLERLKEVINNMNADDVVSMYNHYADAHSYETVFSMSEFDEIVMPGQSFFDVYDRLSNDFDRHNRYFWFNGYGNIESADAKGVIDELVNIDDLASWIDLDPRYAKKYPEIEEFFDSLEEDEEEE